MKRIACLPLYFVWVLSAYPQGSQTELCVINIQGAAVYKTPDFRAPKVKVLAVGEALFPEAILDRKDTCSTPGGLQLDGNWVKLPDGEGFVFSTDLTDKHVEIGEHNFGGIFIDFLGEFISEEMDTVIHKTPKGEFPELIITSKYTKGTTLLDIFQNGPSLRLKQDLKILQKDMQSMAFFDNKS